MSNEVDVLRVQAHNEIEIFVKHFANKYVRLFKKGKFIYKIFESNIPEVDFPYEVFLEITEKRARST